MLLSVIKYFRGYVHVKLTGYATGTVLKSVREPEYPDLEFKTV